MKKSILLSFYLLCTCSLSACGMFRSDDEVNPEYISVDEQNQVIDATTNPSDRCGVDGIGCNDSPLINYTKTEADYRAYGERTKRDHLYTQEAAGNNISATVRPGYEEDIVNEPEPEYEPGYEPTYEVARNNVQRARNIDGYEVICTDECGSLIDDINDDTITSEFTEDSFNIADNNDDIEFTEYGDNAGEKIAAAEQNITDDTILTWEANEGDTLRELLTKWSGMAGWKLLWNTNRNYTLNAGVMFKGKFTDVSAAIIRAFARAKPAPIATFYKGNRVIVVETMENENAY